MIIARCCWCCSANESALTLIPDAGWESASSAQALAVAWGLQLAASLGFSLPGLRGFWLSGSSPFGPLPSLASERESLRNSRRELLERSRRRERTTFSGIALRQQGLCRPRSGSQQLAASQCLQGFRKIALVHIVLFDSWKTALAVYQGS